MKKLFNNSTKTEETASKSKRKFLKTFGFTSLALLMGIAGTMAFAPLANTSLSGNLNVSAQEQNFDLGLRPETDPVVYTTESGLEIKKSNGKYTSTTTITTNKNLSITQDLTSFYYFTMGTYSGTIYTFAGGSTTANYTVSNEPVNWLIIGRGEFNFYDDSPAGIAIKNESSKQEIAVANNLYLPLDMQSIPEGPDNEIPDNCFLVISEKLLGQMYFNSTKSITYYMWEGTEHYITTGEGNYGNRYRYFGNRSNGQSSQSWNTTSNAGGSLYNYVNNLFSKNNSTGTITGDNKLGFTQAQADLIVPQQLYTFYSKGSTPLQETPSTDGGTYYTMFPLASRDAHSSTYQNFCIENYFTNLSQVSTTYIGSTTLWAYFWTRSGNTATVDTADRATDVVYNTFSSHATVGCVAGVRPAFVLKLI